MDTIYRSALNRDVPPAAPGEFVTVPIGPLRVWPPVVLAPMAGVTNPPFRTLCRRFGAGLYVSEMITARALVEGNRKTVLMASFSPEEKTRCLRRLIDALVPGRGDDARPGDAQELAATGVLSLEIVDVSTKVRAGGPKDLDCDRDLPVWSGVVPLTMQRGEPIPADDLVAGVTLPGYLKTTPG